jgi:predicted O-methyltransferase YrrM
MPRIVDVIHQRVHALLLPAPARRYLRAARQHAGGDPAPERDGAHPAQLRLLIRLAQGKRRTVEIGTAYGWTAAILAVTDSQRHVTAVDPIERPGRMEYVQLAGDAAERVQFVQGYGETAPTEPTDFLFIDGSHERESTVKTFLHWRDALMPGAVVVFHDYHASWPGVVEAVQELGLDGADQLNMFIWRNPA